MSGARSGRCPECDRLLMYRGECAGCGYEAEEGEE